MFLPTRPWRCPTGAAIILPILLSLLHSAPVLAASSAPVLAASSAPERGAANTNTEKKEKIGLDLTRSKDIGLDKELPTTASRPNFAPKLRFQNVASKRDFLPARCVICHERVYYWDRAAPLKGCGHAKLVHGSCLRRSWDTQADDGPGGSPQAHALERRCPCCRRSAPEDQSALNSRSMFHRMRVMRRRAILNIGNLRRRRRATFNTSTTPLEEEIMPMSPLEEDMTTVIRVMVFVPRRPALRAEARKSPSAVRRVTRVLAALWWGGWVLGWWRTRAEYGWSNLASYFARELILPLAASSFVGGFRVFLLGLVLHWRCFYSGVVLTAFCATLIIDDASPTLGIIIG